MLPILFTLNTPWGAQPIYSYGVLLGLSLIAGYPLVVRVGAREPGMNAELLGNALHRGRAVRRRSARARCTCSRTASCWKTRARAGSRSRRAASPRTAASSAACSARRCTCAASACSLAAFADAAAPALALGTVLTRIGCYLYGCDFGTPLDDGAPALAQAPRHVSALAATTSCTCTARRRWLLSRRPLRPGARRRLRRCRCTRRSSTKRWSALLLLGLAFVLLRRRSFARQVALIVAIALRRLALRDRVPARRSRARLRVRLLVRRS